jgi:hypothetical protein
MMKNAWRFAQYSKAAPITSGALQPGHREEVHEINFVERVNSLDDLRRRRAPTDPHNPSISSAVDEELLHRVAELEIGHEPAEHPLEFRETPDVARMITRSALRETDESRYRRRRCGDRMHLARSLLDVNAGIRRHALWVRRECA